MRFAPPEQLVRCGTLVAVGTIRRRLRGLLPVRDKVVHLKVGRHVFEPVAGGAALKSGHELLGLGVERCVQRGLAPWLGGAVPQIGPVVGRWVAHEKHLLQPNVGRVQRLAADAQRVLVQTELHGICRSRVHDGLEREARLLVLVRETPWVVAIARPNLLLSVDQGVEAGPQLVQPVGRDDVSQDHVTVFEELLGINLHRISSAPRSVMRRA